MGKEIITWDKKLIIGIKEIDDQHKKFIEMINKVSGINPLKTDKNKLKEILDDLIEYARVHFTTEEDYFEKWNYPYSNEHKIEHEKLTLRVLQFMSRFESRGADILDELLLFLKEWLENHLKNHDFKYRDYFKVKGYIK